MARKKPQWQIDAKARIDAMSNEELLDHLLEMTEARVDGDREDSFEASYAEVVLRSRLAVAGFIASGEAE
jgi:hypothetical protein